MVTAKSKGKVQIGILMVAILMMGVVGIASSLTVIGEQFPNVSQTAIMSLISIPCIVIIPITLLVGKLMQVMSKKVLAVFGVVLFLIGGILPAFMTSFTIIMVLRGILGAGVGIVQVICVALVAENFEGSEREKVQGNLMASQMLGCAVMVFVGGWLGSIGWSAVFYVHVIAILSLLGAVFLIPNLKPSALAKTKSAVPTEKAKLTGELWYLATISFLGFLIGQIYSNGNAYVLVEKGIGDSAASGLGMAFFCVGGVITGLLFGKVAQALGKYTMGIGILVLGASFVIMAVALNISVFYVGCFMYGIGCSVYMAGLYINVAASVKPVAIGMAVSIVTCMQNFGQFASPYIVNPITSAIGGNVNVVSFYCAAIVLAIVGLLTIFVSAAAKKADESAMPDTSLNHK